MNIRRSVSILSMTAIVLAFAGDAAWALSVQATTLVNGSAGPVTMNLGTTAKTAGRVAYDTNIGPVPVPLHAYFEQGIAFQPFRRPVVVSGNQLAPFYYAAVSGPTGKQAWVLTTNFWIAGTYTATVTSTEYAENRTGTSVYYNYTGTGTCGCTIEDEDFVRVYVN